MRVLIADDHPPLRRGVMEILVESFPNAEFGEAGTTTEALEKVGQERWDLLVLDIFMPGRSGLEVLSEARHLAPHLPILVFSHAPEDQMAERVLAARAAGFLNKQSAPSELVLAVRKILSGGKYLTSALAERLADRLADGATRAKCRLSDRECEVLRRVVEGESLKEIADAMCLSPKTISTYHARLWRKLNVSNDVQLVHYALEHGLLRT